MIKQPNMKLIGTFIVSCGLVVVLLFGYFLKSKFIQNDIPMVMYFDESVQGLDVGAPVLFKGVKVGEVTSIKLKSDYSTMEFLIPVYAKLYNNEELSEGYKDERANLNILIKKGLRARLAVNSMLTGQLLIEFDFFPKTKVVLHEDARNRFEIPTIDSPFAEFSKTLQVMPINKIARDVHSITQTLETQLPLLLEHLDSTISTIDTILKDNQNNTGEMLKNFGTAANNLSRVSRTLNATMGENSSDIVTMIENFSAAAASLKNLTDYLQMHPSALIRGKDY